MGNLDLAIADFSKQLQTRESQLKEVLPDGLSVETFRQAAIIGVNNNPKILDCTPRSVFNSLIECAFDGLKPNGKEAALVPFFNAQDSALECAYIPMREGIVKRAFELGDIESITCVLVHENDHFKFTRGDEEKLDHAPHLENPGKIIGSYAIFRKDGRVIYREYVPFSEMEKIRKVSKMADKGAWKIWRDEMYKKIPLRRGAKSIPMSDRLKIIVEREDVHIDFDRLKALEDATEPKDVNPLTEDVKAISYEDRPRYKTDPNEFVTWAEKQFKDATSPDMLAGIYKTCEGDFADMPDGDKERLRDAYKGALRPFIMDVKEEPEREPEKFE